MGFALKWQIGQESVVLEKAGDRALKIVRYAFDLQHWLLDYDRSQMDQLFTEK
ncbi:hypothetical protein [Bacillus pumilus]|uniref:hypothetical protein n=1 Tax=Bacillus pumilus TaxID=1408 RepID=UPI0031F548E4